MAEANKMKAKMKKFLFILILFQGSFFGLQAQNNQRSEKIEALKIAFITQQVGITSSEAQQFWPVYNQYQSEIRNVRTTSRNGDALDSEQKLLNIRKKYKPSFEKILGVQKSNKLFNAERDFRNVLIKRLKSQRQQRFK